MIYRVFFFLAIAMLPLYLWDSGGMQISHALIIVAAGSFYVSRGIRVSQADGVLLFLAAFAFARESAVALVDFNIGGLLSASYILFSAIVFNAVRNFGGEERNRRAIANGLMAAVAVAIAGVAVKGYGFSVDSEGGRAIGTFNNPNQLGYFSVCSFSAAILLYQYGDIRRKFNLFAFFVAAVYLSLASLSKAAMLTTMLSGLLIGFTMSSSRRKFFVGACAASVVVIIALMIYQSGYLDDFKFVHRLAGIGKQDDDSLAERGYLVVTEASGLEIFYGMGFEKVKEYVGHEVHSTSVSFFANYGVIGGGSFIIFMLMWAKKLVTRFGWIVAVGIGAPPIIYGITHNGSRFTIFWILIALSFARVMVSENQDSSARKFGHMRLFARGQ